MCTSQKATSCCLYKHRSWPIVIYHQRNQSNYYFFILFALIFYFSFYFCQLDLLAAALTSKVIVVLTYPLSRRCLTGVEALSSSAGGVPDCRRNRQNRIVRFAKPEGLIFPILSRGFRSLFVLCGNTFL
jgi:hypothetical protein